MNCSEVRERLPEYHHADLEPGIAEHLSQCPGCQAEYAALRKVYSVLNAVPSPRVEVDLPRLYRDAAERQARRAQRWRRVAIGGISAAAAALLIAVGLRLEVRAEAHQLVVRWGQPSETPDAVAVPNQLSTMEKEIRLSAAAEERLRVIADCVHGMYADIEQRDRRQQENVRSLQVRLVTLQRLVNERWAEDARDRQALYVLAKGERQ